MARPLLAVGGGDISVSVDALRMADGLEHLFAWTGIHSEEAILEVVCVLVPGGRPRKGEGSLLSIGPGQEHRAEVGRLTCEWHP